MTQAAYQAAAAKQVFLSHADEDKQAALCLCRALEAAGFPCWIAPRDIPPGEPWAAAIVQAIGTSRATVLLVSRHSLASRQVTREIGLADNAHQPVLAVRIDGSKLSGDLEYFLLNTQWYDAASGLERELPAIVNSVRELLSPDPLEAAAESPGDRAPRRAAPLRLLAAEARRVLAAWLGVVGRGPAFIAALELDDLRTLMFAGRFLIYMQLVCVWIALSIVEAARRRPLHFTLAYVVSGLVETVGAILVFHWCFRRAGGDASLQKSATVCLLYAAFGPLVTLCLAPVRSSLEPFFRLDFSHASPAQLAEALAPRLGVLGVALVLACAAASTVVLAWSFAGMLRSLRLVHRLNVGRSWVAMTAGLLVYLLFVLVFGTPFEKALFAG